MLLFLRFSMSDMASIVNLHALREVKVELAKAQTLSASLKNLPLSFYVQRCALSCWMKQNINKKECALFQKGPSEEICKCGYSKEAHNVEAIKPEDFVGETWNKHRHVLDVPTNAFGEIQFDGLQQTTAKYARVSSDTSPEVLYGLLTEQWQLLPPNLLISVTGGAKNFNLKPRLRNMFHRGLIKVAQTTGAWIITGGTNAGVMKHVGQAVRDYSLSNSIQGQIVAIGVATWGVIHNREALINEEGCFPALYMTDKTSQGRLSCLDKNHTHFLLVDDGTHGHYGVEIELRTCLEKCISGKQLGKKDRSVTIPVVCVVLEGGPGTLNTIFNAMKNGTPCVIFEGTGRIADVIAQVSGLPLQQITITLIHQLMEKFFGQEYKKFTELSVIEWTKKIQDIVRMSHLLTIFRVTEDSHGDVDVAILKALLKASRSSETLTLDCWKTQLELAVAWNRVDIAKTEIFTEDSLWSSADLHQAMFSALVGNKPQFVTLLLENGMSLRKFLQNEETLCNLYREMPSCFFLRKLAKRVHSKADLVDSNSITLTHVSDEVRHLLGNATRHIYPPSVEQRYCMSTEDLSLSLSKNNGAPRPAGEVAQRDASSDVFLWAVLQNNRDLAEIAWEQCQDSICAALAATRILKKLAGGESDAEEAEEMLNLASHYEEHAIGVFSECYNTDEERALKLLVHVSNFWGGTTSLWLALKAEDKRFVALSGVQAFMTRVWCGELSVDNHILRVLICMLFFPLIYTGFLAFRHDELFQREAKKQEATKKVERVTGKTHGAQSLGSAPDKPLSCWDRLVSLYGSPQVKFYWNIVSYFFFLNLFAGVLMMDFHATPTVPELLLYVWVFSLVCEEFRQLFCNSDGFGFKIKAKLYITDLWNILDVLSILLFLLGLAFRLRSELFYAGKIVLCIDFVVFCLRLMAIFTISQTLGPKIIIVRRMMKDLFFFMFLLSIWVVAYGVAKQGILIHNDTRLDWIFRGAIYEPYLIIFGNFPENLAEAKFSLDSCSMNGTDPLKPKCPILNENHTPVFPEWLTITMLCVYLLFANILLLNLLIAIFNFTFQEVQDNTDRIWKFQRYELIKEYHSRPAAPPPFIIFSHISLLIRSIWMCKSHCKSKDLKDQTEAMELLSWEALMKDRYLLSVKQETSRSTERLILDTAQKVTSISERLEREEESVSAVVLKRLTRLEEQVNQSAIMLQWIMDSLKSTAKEEKPDTSNAADESSSCLRNESASKDSFQVNCRQYYYPSSKVTRFPVPDEKVPWQVSFSSYQPSCYTCEDGNDCIDGQDGADKFRNPGGRTGIRGRGALSHFGPNLHLDLVLTRWKDGERSALEYLAICDSSQGIFTLPSGPVDCDDHLPETLKTTLGNKLYRTINAKVSEGKKLPKCYVDDSRNTANAWVETTVLNIHLDRTSQVMVDINTQVRHSSSLQWEELSSKNRLPPDQRESLQMVAELHNRKL
uniref:Transient receptor potential cation channel, subfamily M, member 2 n=1 Tax=Oryzias latipes TaxID=8090 RepID=A0A3P9LM50_ORYLA